MRKRWISGVLAVLMLLSMTAAFPTTARAASAMELSEAAVNILKTIEGFSAKPYWDVSQWTVGYGTQCPEDKRAEYEANGISEEEALLLLAQALDRFEASINSFVDQHGLSLAQHQFDALVMFSYNCGTAWTYETTGYFNNAVRNGATGTAFIYAICLWSSAGGEFILTKRRMSEANMYLNGVYEAYNVSDDGTYPETFKYVYMDGNGGQASYIMHGYDASDSSGVITTVTAPTGVDSAGNPFTYEFAGWYTAATGGSKVEVLDGSLADGSVLFAQWKDSFGQIVALPKGTPCSVNVTTTESVNVRTGPGAYYPKAQEMLSGGTPLTITETYTYSGSLWGKSQYGWVSLRYTDYESVLSGQETWPKTGRVTGTNVNIRSGAGTSYPVQYQLNTGDGVTIHERVHAEGMSWGRLSDGNWICLTYVSFDPVNVPEGDGGNSGDSGDESGGGITGDINADGAVNKDDAIYLLRHVVYPDKYPLSVSGDINGDGAVNKDDAIYLLRHVVYPDKYPLR